MMTQGDDMRTLDERLRASNPIQTAALRQPTLDAALVRIVDELPAGGSHDTRSVRRWRGRLAGASLGTVAAIGFAGVAAAGGIALGSGFFDSPGSTESISGEEYVNVASEQFPAVFDAAAKAYPLPPGETYDEVRQNVLGTGGLIRVTAALLGAAPPPRLCWRASCALPWPPPSRPMTTRWMSAGRWTTCPWSCAKCCN